jgi:hypothetical protein
MTVRAVLLVPDRHEVSVAHVVLDPPFLSEIRAEGVSPKRLAKASIVQAIWATPLFTPGEYPCRLCGHLVLAATEDRLHRRREATPCQGAGVPR